jgi:hypothetical protein
MAELPSSTATPRATRLFGAAGAPLPPTERAFHERAFSAVRSALEEAGDA